MVRYAWRATSAMLCSRCGEIGLAPRRMSIEPKKGAINVPTELNACAILSRLEAVAAGPMMVTYGFAATWPVVMPAARMTTAIRKMGKAA